MAPGTVGGGMGHDAIRGAREALLEAVVDSLDDAMVVFDTDGRVVTANPSMERLTGLDLTSSIGRTLTELDRSDFMDANADGIEALHAFVQHVAATGDPLHDDDNSRIEPGGRRVRMSRRLNPVRHGGEVIGVLLVIRDLSSIHSSLFRNAAVGMARLDWQGAVREVNPALEQLLGRSEDELYGEAFGSLVHPDEQEQAHAHLDGLGQDGADRFQVEHRFHRPDGSVVWGSTSAAAVVLPGQQKGRSTVVVVEDITDRKQLEAINSDLRESERNLLDSLAWEASHDALTGLANRRGFMQALERSLATTGPERPVGLLFIDLDRFKAINDTYGHDVGDAVLVEVGRRIRSCTREQEVVARLGGDEFTVLLRDAPAHSTDSVADRIHLALSEPVVVGTLVLHVAGSIGTVVHDTVPCAPSVVLRQADEAMYARKQGACREQALR